MWISLSGHSWCRFSSDWFLFTLFAGIAVRGRTCLPWCWPVWWPSWGSCCCSRASSGTSGFSSSAWSLLVASTPCWRYLVSGFQWQNGFITYFRTSIAWYWSLVSVRNFPNTYIYTESHIYMTCNIILTLDCLTHQVWNLITLIISVLFFRVCNQMQLLQCMWVFFQFA